MKNCTHSNVVVRKKSDNYVNVICKDCGQGWSGPPHPWVSYRGKFNKPPKWVGKAVNGRNHE